MATNHVVRKGSIYRTGVVLKTKTNLYFYRMWYGISYFQNYYSITSPTPLHFMTSFQSKKHCNCVLPHRHKIIQNGYCSAETDYIHLQSAS